MPFLENVDTSKPLTCSKCKRSYPVAYFPVDTVKGKARVRPDCKRCSSRNASAKARQPRGA